MAAPMDEASIDLDSFNSNPSSETEELIDTKPVVSAKSVCIVFFGTFVAASLAIAVILFINGNISRLFLPR